MAVILTYAQCVDGKKTWFSLWNQISQEGQTRRAKQRLIKSSTQRMEDREKRVPLGKRTKGQY